MGRGRRCQMQGASNDGRRAAMAAVRFENSGANRSYLDLYLGFGWAISVANFLQAFLLWQMARLAADQPGIVRRMVAAFVVANAIGVWIAWHYIYPLPAVLAAVLLVPLVLALTSPHQQS